jgi:hypothetical protein
MAEVKPRAVRENVERQAARLLIDRTGASAQSRARLLVLRLRTWLWRGRLDRDIALGKEGPYDRLRAFRGQRLCDGGEQKRLASALERVLDAYRHPAPLSSAAPIDRRAVRAAEPLLEELIRCLRSADEIEPRGIALGWDLLTKADGPFYAPVGGSRDPGHLWYAALSLLFALGPVHGVQRSRPPVTLR